ncbi:uroporphyrinogen decarboxylase family protein [Actinomycetota bacterium]
MKGRLKMKDSMTGRARLTKTFKGEKVDRISVSPFLWANNVYEMFKYTPTIDKNLYPDDFDFSQKYVEYADHFGFDVLFSLGLLWENFLPPSAENWEVSVEKEGDADKQKRTTIIKTPGGDLKQIQNFSRSSKHLIVFAHQEYPIKTKKDFEIFTKYVPPAQYVDLDIIKSAKIATGDRGLVNPAVFGVFNTLNQFRKLEDMMMDPIMDEGFYREMMEFFTEWNIKHFVDDVVPAGSDSIELGGNLATSGVGPQFFKDYVMDYENRFAGAIHDAGAFVVYHNCGDAQTIMHLYNDLEIDVWGYVTGPPFGDVILDDVLKIIRPDMALRGNIDQVEFLLKATPAEIKERVKELFEKVKPRGNWILSCSDFFFDGTPYENIFALTEAGIEFGQY